MGIMDSIIDSINYLSPYLPQSKWATTFFILCFLAGLGGLLDAWKKKNFYKNALKWRKIRVATTTQGCITVAEEIKKNLKKADPLLKVIGMDAEWRPDCGGKNPVALLQLATLNGYCALIRLNRIEVIPEELRVLLADETILKVGNQAPEDAERLLEYTYHRLKVAGTVDLRYLAKYLQFVPLGLAKMSKNHLNLDKSSALAFSNWDNYDLTDSEIDYAATDAQLGILLFNFFNDEYIKRISSKDFKKHHNTPVDKDIIAFSTKYIDMQFSPKVAVDSIFNATTETSDTKSNEDTQTRNIITKLKRPMKNSGTFSKPLYDNCLLETPDGILLCTCDRRKAEWYVSKDLGTIVENKEPFTVRLKFEPNGRPVGVPGKYYQQPKLNVCVVCGKSESFIRKNVIPKEYRKYFPDVMKSHISHDVLLLCPSCHQLSNSYDNIVRENLTKICDAPIASGKTGRLLEDRNLKSIKSTANALLNRKEQIPSSRLEELKIELLKLTGKKEITIDMLNESVEIDTTLPNAEYSVHGERVVDYYKIHGGIVQLEMIWRENFLNRMNPKYLPEFWSVNHNLERLQIRLDEGRIDESDIIIAGIKNYKR